MMENLFAISATGSFTQEWNLIAHTEFDILAYMQMSLCQCLQIEIIPHTILQTETDIMASFLARRSLCII